MKYRQGWTMVELLLVLAIFSLLAGLASSSLGTMLENKRAAASLSQLYHLLRYSRHEAVVRGHFVTVCPSLDRLRCNGDWSAPVIVFTDSNSDETINGDDTLLRELRVPVNGQAIQFRASARRQFMQFKPTGVSNGIAGKVMICEQSRTFYPRKLVISLGGRISMKNIDIIESCGSG
jgi:type IV fimbrial biogenesis protein FimT